MRNLYYIIIPQLHKYDQIPANTTQPSAGSGDFALARARLCLCSPPLAPVTDKRAHKANLGDYFQSGSNF